MSGVTGVGKPVPDLRSQVQIRGELFLLVTTNEIAFKMVGYRFGVQSRRLLAFHS